MPRGRTLKRTVSASPQPVTPSKRKKSNIKDKSDPEELNHTINTDIRTKQHLTCASTEVGVILSFGAGDVGQLGLGEDVVEKLRPALIPELSDVVEIFAGGMHSVCLTKNGDVLTWGCNDEGALGREGSESQPGKVQLSNPVVMISAGDSHTAALLETGQLFAWGSFRDATGNMGLHTGNIEKTPVPVLAEHFITKIASGADHLAVLTDKGQLYTLGCGQQGQLGRLSSRETVRERRLGIASSLQPGIVTVKASRKTTFNQIWAGTYGTFATDQKNDLFVFGLNNYHQIGLPNEEPYFRPTKSSVFKGKIWTKITSGLHHTLALDADGCVYALGRKEYGRLGLGEDCQDANTLTIIPKIKDRTCVDIACGSTTSFAVSSTGELFSWGMGTGGALGSGEEEDIYEPTLVKGKQLADRSVLRVSSGGQHTIVLAKPVQQNNNISNNSNV